MDDDGLKWIIANDEPSTDDSQTIQQDGRKTNIIPKEEGKYLRFIECFLG